MKNKGEDMDDRNFKAFTGLRAIYEQRACPPDEVLFAGKRSKEMEAHLGYCRYCNERLEMTTEDHSAWQELGGRLKPLIVGNGQNPSPAPGQIWSLDRERLGGWGPYDRYYNPPLVLVLQLQDNGRTVRVAQVCAEEGLKGEDGADVWLDEGIGFAESWNVYSVHRDDLKACRGEIDRSLAKQVLKQSSNLSPSKEVDANVQRFRELEVQLGALVAMRAMPQVMAAVEEYETANEKKTIDVILEDLLGIFSSVKNRLSSTLSGWRLPEGAPSLFDYLSEAVPLLDAPKMAADAGVVCTVNLVPGKSSSILLKTVAIAITNDDYLDDGSYFIAGKLSETSDITIHLLAKLEVGDNVIAESQSQITPGTAYVTIVFKGVPATVCELDNVKMLLVSL